MEETIIQTLFMLLLVGGVFGAIFFSDDGLVPRPLTIAIYGLGIYLLLN